ncbi:putative DnaJ domain, Chaperone J-domain superfamily [Dioscorea sansibarensis]
MLPGKGSVISHLHSTMATPCVGEITILWSFAPLGSQGRRGLSSRTRRLRFNCRASSRMEEDWISSPTASPYQILGIDPMSCSPSQLKAAFRSRVKEYHPDVCKDVQVSDMIIKRVIHAYEVLLKRYQHESPDRS